MQGEKRRSIDLPAFVKESNRIEGVIREPAESEILALERFLARGPSVESLVEFVRIIQPDARLRKQAGLDVVVGRYYPPRGGPQIEESLAEILFNLESPYLTHQAYEALHPFTDGNGRSGRALWLWTMGGIKNAPLGFLHHWYYQSLQNFCAL